MLPKDLLRREPDRVRTSLTERNYDPHLMDRWLTLDTARRTALVELEEFKRQRNEASKAIGKIKQQGGEATDEIARVGTLKTRIAALDKQVTEHDEALGDIELSLPNLQHESVPVGEDETANRVERIVGTPRDFDFEPIAHWDLGPALGILDFERGAKLAGARFTVYSGDGARLERALINFMLDLHCGEHGYTEFLPPFMANSATLTGTGQLPKFGEDLFKLEGHDYYLIPTAEVPLTNLYAGEILAEDSLPKRLVAYTPCFRAEAGSYGKDVRGLIRQHQFNKVELVHITAPDSSYEALEELTGNAEKILQLLELPYRTVCLSTGDMSIASAKTYDLEVWLPGQSAYREISSCSNCTDFQARRAGLRYRPADGGKPRFVHTLNGSGLAVGRTLVAILENYQQADGSVLIPKVLQHYFDGRQTISPPSGS